ncbi:MAG TPA: glycogen/starch/alpha-glucan phosphorylase [Tissierellia bacterium]|nr:glycogen/starch/alpha-glucan phosphorylase [Tissierellia bacterium]
MNLFSKEDFIFNVKTTLRSNYGVGLDQAEDYEIYNSVSKVIMRILSQYWEPEPAKHTHRSAYYLSSEYLMGRALSNNLTNLTIYRDVKDALEEVGLNLNAIEDVERDAGLGNGGLGRLAACFLDSAATHGYPLHGYGIRYEYGIFKQKWEDGRQVEKADDWLRYGDPWSIRRESERVKVHYADQTVYAVPYDTPIVGYNSNIINTLRLWRSEPIEEFNFELFNNQDYDAAMYEKNRAEDISRVLYPNDDRLEGKILRLKQQYFFVSASIQDLLAKHKQKTQRLDDFAERNALQLNDTHPAVAIAEIIRLLIDQEDFSFEDALKLAQQTFSYTNHTIMSEALESWDEDLYRRILPRIYDIICQIDQVMIKDLQNKGLSEDRINDLRIIRDGRIRMAHLSIYGSKFVNGVAALHTQILISQELKHFYDVWPEKFQNKTNGITQRRWLLLSNPELSELITETLGDDEWIRELDELERLSLYENDPEFIAAFRAVKQQKKNQLADYIREHEGIEIDPTSLFDIQIKRLHEYKRQLMNALLIVDTYYKLKSGQLPDFQPRTYFFGAKSAPGYYLAKRIIAFILAIQEKVNHDPETKDRLKVVFVENYNVTYAEKLVPAADLSEQISTAGKEASGTGNMKFMLNGAPTIGTMDGANVEIVEASGMENNFIFGLSVDEVNSLRPNYRPRDYYESVEGLKAAVDSLIDGSFAPPETFRQVYNSLLEPNGWDGPDAYMVLADFESYREAHRLVDQAFADPIKYAQMGIQNMIHSGIFSSDRTIADYAREIWFIKPINR